MGQVLAQTEKKLNKQLNTIVTEGNWEFLLNNYISKMIFDSVPVSPIKFKYDFNFPIKYLQYHQNPFLQ